LLRAKTEADKSKGKPMAASERSTIAAVLPDRAHAETAIDELWRIGIPQNHIGILSPAGNITEATTATEPYETNAARGAETGAIAGAVVGTVAGALATVLIPGIGAVLAGGILSGIVLGGAAGAAAGTFMGPFIALGFTEEEARGYERELKAGRTVLVVKAGDRLDKVRSVLRSHLGRELELARVSGPSGS
jgi:Heat induced stress protein YflT